MTSKLKGIIFYSKLVKDNDLYIKILSSDDTVISGMVYGGNSSKKKLIFQNGYFIDFLYTKKNENSPPIFLGEITKPYVGSIFEDKYKLNAVRSILNLIRLSIVEGQRIKHFYTEIEQLIENIINESSWIVFYCEWLFNLLKLIGYQVDYKKNINKPFFNLVTQEFNRMSCKSCLNFPFNLFSSEKEISFENINAIFLIFESIFLKNHLGTSKLNMLTSYVNFKSIILKRLR